MDTNLIFDIGCNNGDDADFYMRKGFRVVAVDADPDLCKHCEERFSKEIASGRCHVVNGAISNQPGSTVTLYKNELSDWNSMDPFFVERNAKLGKPSIPIQVPAVTTSSLLEHFGVPYYLKVDIEGMDLVPVEALVGKKDLPRYVSIEVYHYDLAKGLDELLTLAKAGYSEFLFFNQGNRAKMKAPNPAREGLYADYDPTTVSTGLFGAELDGQWLDFDSAVDRLQELHRLDQLFRSPAYSTSGVIGKGQTLLSKIHNRFRRHVLGDPIAWHELHARTT